MKDAESFLHQIRADPLDDTVRLVYADYLEEHAASIVDTDRAEFIRAQVASAKLTAPYCKCNAPAGPDLDVEPCTEWCALRAREIALLARHYTSWTLPFPGPWMPHGQTNGRVVFMSSGDNRHRCQVHYRRGFIAMIGIPANDFMVHGRRIFQTHPVTAVTLQGATPRPRDGAADAYHWHAAHRVPTQWHQCALPRAVYDLLCGYTYAGASKFYLSERAALGDASLACVTWGRHRARLPEIYHLLKGTE